MDECSILFLFLCNFSGGGFGIIDLQCPAHIMSSSSIFPKHGLVALQEQFLETGHLQSRARAEPREQDRRLETICLPTTGLHLAGVISLQSKRCILPPTFAFAGRFFIQWVFLVSYINAICSACMCSRTCFFPNVFPGLHHLLFKSISWDFFLLKEEVGPNEIHQDLFRGLLPR